MVPIVGVDFVLWKSLPGILMCSLVLPCGYQVELNHRIILRVSRSCLGQVWADVTDV